MYMYIARPPPTTLVCLLYQSWCPRYLAELRNVFGRKARDVWWATGRAVAGAASRLQQPGAATPQRSPDSTQETPEGSAEGRAALHSYRAFPQSVGRCATLHALPRVRGAAVPSRHFRHATPGQQSVYHVVPGESEEQLSCV